jgi:putative RecB family exonuclease
MPTYSHSRVSTFEQCALKFKFKYIDRIETEEEETIESFMGKKVHEALEWLYGQVKMNVVPELKKVLEYFEDRWKKNFNKEIKVNNKDYSPEHYFSAGKKFIENYYKRYEPFKENTIALEKKISLDLDGTGKYVLIGYVDRLVYNKEKKEYEIHDYKTSNSLAEQAYLEQDRQLALYSLAIKSIYQDANKICLIWHFLAFDKEFCIYKTDEQLEKLKKDTIELIKKIESTKKFEANVTGLCKWCEYQSICPKFKHLFENEEKPINEYLKEEGVVLVNKYAETYAKKKELETEINKIKEAVIVYAKKKGVEVIFGSNNKLSISFSEKFKFPSKGSEERKELDNLLKNLHKWEEISTLDTFALEKIIEDGSWPKEILEKIKRFGDFEEFSVVRLSRRKELEDE